MYVVRNAGIVTPTEVRSDRDMLVVGNRIESFIPAGSSVNDAEEIDAQGGYLVPGFVDIHSDYIEHIAAPRPTSLMDFHLALREAERELISHGITTIFHSLSLYKDSEFGIKPIRELENVRRLVDIIHESHRHFPLVRHRFHARFELDNFEQLPALESFIKERKVHLISFMDHSPGQGQFRDMELFRRTLRGYRNVSEEDLDGIVLRHQTKEKIALDTIGELTALAREFDIAVASHDDDSEEKISLVSSWGTTISEFPITIPVARAAREAGLHTVAGAPNILLGGSHSGNMKASEAVRAGVVDILCSDYYPASLLHAVFALHFDHGLGLPELVRLVTLNPAKAVGLDAELGSVEVGKRADILIIEMIDGNFPVITGVFVDGSLVSRTRYRN